MLGNLSIFLITAILGINSIKKQKKDSTMIEETNEIKEETNDFREEQKKEDMAQKEETNSLENTIVQEETITNHTNYLSIGMFSISAIFLILTITFSIFLIKHQLNARKKSSK